MLRIVFFLFRKNQNAMMAAMTMAAIPPMTPPAMAPVLEGEPLLEESPESGDVPADAVGVLGRVEEAAAEKNGRRLFSLACSILVYHQWAGLTLAGGHDGQQTGSPWR